MIGLYSVCNSNEFKQVYSELQSMSQSHSLLFVVHFDTDTKKVVAKGYEKGWSTVPSSVAQRETALVRVFTTFEMDVVVPEPTQTTPSWARTAARAVEAWRDGMLATAATYPAPPEEKVDRDRQVVVVAPATVAQQGAAANGLRGKVAAQALVFPRETMAVAVAELIRDAARSLLVRLEILADELEEEGRSGDLKNPASPMALPLPAKAEVSRFACEYLSERDTDDDVLARVAEIFPGMKAAVNKVERLPEQPKAAPKSKAPAPSATPPEQQQQQQKSGGISMATAGALATAVAAAVAGLLWSYS